MIERSLNAFYTNEPNDVLAIKAHYLKTFVDNLADKDTDDTEKSCVDWCKKYEEIFEGSLKSTEILYSQIRSCK